MTSPPPLGGRPHILPVKLDRYGESNDDYFLLGIFMHILSVLCSFSFIKLSVMCVYVGSEH